MTFNEKYKQLEESRRISQLYLRQMPLQAHGVDAHVEAQTAHLRQLRLHQKVATVHQAKSLHLAVGLVWRANRHGFGKGNSKSTYGG